MIRYQHDSVISYQFEHLQAFSHVRHGIFTRLGGSSAPPYDSLNTTIHDGGDQISHVVSNRQRVQHALGLANAPGITLWQIHGADVFTYSAEEQDWRTDWAHASYFTQAWTEAEARKGDALITREYDVTLALCFADCVPIVFYDPQQNAIGIAHGGWRGTARGIVIATVDAMQKQFGSRPQDLYAGIAPAIGPCCYEVSQNIQRIFMGEEHFDTSPTESRYQAAIRESACFSLIDEQAKTSLRLDLQETNRRQLQLAGIPAQQIEVMRICTSCNTDLFFSHRREQGRTGRFAVAMALSTKDNNNTTHR